MVTSGIVPTEPNKEAEKLFQKGQKALKTSLFQWSPDYMNGSIYFSKAAKLFKASRHNQQAIEAYLAYSDCSFKMDETTGAAEGVSEAAFLSSDYEQSVNWLEQADTYYKMGGYNERGLTLMKNYANELLARETDEATKMGMKIYETRLLP